MRSRRTSFFPFELLLALLILVETTFTGASQAPDPTVTPAAYLPLIQRILPTPPPGPAWLDYLNDRRKLGELPALVENTDWSSGCWNHSRYMVKNNIIEHSENPSLPYYTPEGDLAARNSNLAVSSSSNYPDTALIDMWLTGPFHGIGILDPALLTTGYGSYREADGGWQTGGCLDVLRGRGTVPSSVTYPILWPENNTSMPYRSFGGSEWPDPLTSCAGYTVPSGPPIYMLLGPGNVTPSVTAHSFKQGNNLLEHCLFDQNSYTNPDAGSQSLGRSILDSRNAIILMPRNQLALSTIYTVSITTNGQVYTWTFSTAATDQDLAKTADFFIK